MSDCHSKSKIRGDGPCLGKPRAQKKIQTSRNKLNQKDVHVRRLFLDRPQTYITHVLEWRLCEKSTPLQFRIDPPKRLSGRRCWRLM